MLLLLLLLLSGGRHIPILYYTRARRAQTCLSCSSSYIHVPPDETRRWLMRLICFSLFPLSARPFWMSLGGGGRLARNSIELFLYSFFARCGYILVRARVGLLIPRFNLLLRARVLWCAASYTHSLYIVLYSFLSIFIGLSCRMLAADLFVFLLGTFFFTSK